MERRGPRRRIDPGHGGRIRGARGARRITVRRASGRMDRLTRPARAPIGSAIADRSEQATGSRHSIESERRPHMAVAKAMTKSEIAAQLAEKVGITKKQASQFLLAQ